MRTTGQSRFVQEAHKFIEVDFPAGRKKILALQGDPGTGKSYIIAQLQEEFPDLRIIYTAYSGKAVDRLLKERLPARTIHSAFYKVDREKQNLSFILKEPKEIEFEWDVLVIDEGSQVTQEIVNDLKTFGKPIFFIGDYDQIGVVSGTETTYLRDTDLKLDEIVRQAENSNIIKLCKAFKKDHKLPPYGKYGDDVYVVDRDKITPKMILSASQTICGTNETRNTWNKIIRKVSGRKDYLPEVGEKLICTKNTNVSCDGRTIINGTTGIVKSIRDTNQGYFIMQFQPEWAEKPVVIKADKDYFIGKTPKRDSEYTTFEWGYVITVNKAQGSEWDNVLYIIDMNMPKDALIRNINTGMSRAKKRLMLAYKIEEKRYERD